MAVLTRVETEDGRRFEQISSGSRKLVFAMNTKQQHTIWITRLDSETGEVLSPRTSMSVTTTQTPIDHKGTLPDYVPTALIPDTGTLAEQTVAGGVTELWPAVGSYGSRGPRLVSYDRNNPRYAFVTDILRDHDDAFGTHSTDYAWLAARATPVEDYGDPTKHRILVDDVGRSFWVRPFTSGYFCGHRSGVERKDGTIINGEVTAIVKEAEPRYNAVTGEEFHFGWVACLGLLGVPGTRLYVRDDGTMGDRVWWVRDGEDVKAYRRYNPGGEYIGTYAPPLATGNRTLGTYTQANNRILEMHGLATTAFANVAFMPPNGTDNGSLPITLWSGVDFRKCSGGAVIHCDFLGFSGGTDGVPPGETATMARVGCTGRWYIGHNRIHGRRPDGVNVSASPLSDSGSQWDYSLVIDNEYAGGNASMRTSWETDGPSDEVDNVSVDIPGPYANVEDAFRNHPQRFIRPVIDNRTKWNGRGSSSAQFFNIIAGDSNASTLQSRVHIIDPVINTWSTPEYGNINPDWSKPWPSGTPTPPPPYMLSIGSNRVHTSRTTAGDTSQQIGYSSLPMIYPDGSLRHFGTEVIRNGVSSRWGWDWVEEVDANGRPIVRVEIERKDANGVVIGTQEFTSPAVEAQLIKQGWYRKRGKKIWQSPGAYAPTTTTRVYG